MKTYEQAIHRAASALAAGDAACLQMTPREQAERAWSPTSPFTVDELEQRIRARRGLPQTSAAPAA